MKQKKLIYITMKYKRSITSLLKFRLHQVNGLNTILFTLLVILLLTGGCKKWLELEPAGEVIMEDFWKNEEQVTSVVAGCYRSLTSIDAMERIVLWGEGRSDNVISNITGSEFERMINMDLSPSNGYTSWTSFYRTINYCNTFLELAPGVLDLDPNFTNDDYLRLEAEVLSIRALSYFYLVRAFRRVPWVEKAALSDNQDYDITQSEDSVIIKKIISDLNIALVNAPEEYVVSNVNYSYNKGRVTKNMIKALLADIYLWDKQYEKCVLLCNSIIDSKKFWLVTYKDFYRDVFNLGNSAESIFELQFRYAENQMPNYVVSEYFFIPFMFYSPFLIPGVTDSPFNINQGTFFESKEDKRYKDFVNNKRLEGYYYIFKYVGESRTEDFNGNSTYQYKVITSNSNWIVYRLADIFLMKAEALVQLNRSDEDLLEAMRMVNTTYLRSNPELLGDSLKFENYGDKLKMEQLVLRERQRELLFEGKRYFDLMRYAHRENSPSVIVSFLSKKITNNTLQIGPTSILDALYLPVNSGILSRSPKLEQNPYYITGSNNTVN